MYRAIIVVLLEKLPHGTLVAQVVRRSAHPDALQLVHGHAAGAHLILQLIMLAIV